MGKVKIIRDVEIFIDETEPNWCFGMGSFRKTSCSGCKYNMECLAVCEELKPAAIDLR